MIDTKMLAAIVAAGVMALVIALAASGAIATST